MSETTLSEAPRTAALSRDLSELLIELSIGVHRYAMYPPSHPSLGPIVENIIGRLSTIFDSRRTLSIGVAAKQLVIEGVATDQRHPVLADLAERLHHHHLGAVSLSKGVTASEIAKMLATLASESERGGTPIGLLPAEQFPEWEHARLYRVGYEQLELSGAGGAGRASADRASALWLGLAQAALATDDPDAEASDPGAIAQAIDQHQDDSAYDQVIVGYMLQLAEELKGAEGAESEKIRARISGLTQSLDDETLTRLVQFGGDFAQRKRFMLDANQSLAVDSVMKLVEAAASTSQQTISTSMTRMLSKLAAHAEGDGGRMASQADTALRENVEALMADWELDDPNPDAYTAVLDQMSKAAPVFQASENEDSLSGPERLIEMALEIGAYGPTVEKAVSDLVGRGETSVLLERIAEADRDNPVAERIRGHLTSPAEFRRIVADGQVDDAALRSLLDEMGDAAVDPLLDLLAESDSRSVRRRVFDALSGLGPSVGQRALERMADGRWFVLRNMLALLSRLGTLPEGFDAKKYLEHDDPRVRREALPLAVRTARLRDRALAAALGDADERMVRMGLLEIQHAVPQAIVPTLVKRVVTAEQRSPEIRALGAKALAGSSSPLALAALVGLAVAGKTLLGKPRLAPKSSQALAALHALARGWSDNPEARRVLALAAESKDPEIRGAVRAGERGRGSADPT